MKILELIPSLVKKFIGWSCSMFLLGWGGYDLVENKLNANNEKLKSDMRAERAQALSPVQTDIAVIKTDVSWIKHYLEKRKD